MEYVFLHGLGQDASSWEATVRAVGREGVHCPELSGWLQGGEPCYQKLYRALEEYCGQFAGPVRLCGLSLGGILALQYGIGHPEKVDSMALIAARDTMPKGLLRIQNAVFRFMPASVFRSTGLAKNTFISLTKSMMELDFQGELDCISCRTLVLCGERDRANRAATQSLAEGIPGAELSIIAKAGHEVNVDAPEALGQKLNLFFKE